MEKKAKGSVADLEVYLNFDKYSKKNIGRDCRKN